MTEPVPDMPDFHQRAMEERLSISNEWHARPGLGLPSPMRASHLVSLRRETTLDEAREEFAAFCRKHDCGPPAGNSRHHTVEVGACRIKWEGHTEAVSHTVLVPGNGEPPFAETALDFLDSDMQRSLTENMFIGVHLEVVKPKPEDDDRGYDRARSLLGAEMLYGGLMSGESAAVWSSFRLDARGFTRIVIVDLDIGVDRLSRLLQRIVEMETYRMLAMMALPRARDAMAALGALEPRLTEVISSLEQDKSERGQESALRQITGIAARVEQIASSHAYRFAAARAYASIVERRVDDVREQQIERHQRYTNFLLRTLQPAMRTCDATERRADELARRVARAANLLNTMVDMVQKKQNQQLLLSMAERARLQLRLQQAVEGFSIFAISYYAVGMLHYGFKALKSTGVPLNTDLMTGGSAPLVFMLVWFTVRSVRKKLTSQAVETTVD